MILTITKLTKENYLCYKKQYSFVNIPFLKKVYTILSIVLDST